MARTKRTPTGRKRTEPGVGPVERTLMERGHGVKVVAPLPPVIANADYSKLEKRVLAIAGVPPGYDLGLTECEDDDDEDAFARAALLGADEEEGERILCYAAHGPVRVKHLRALGRGHDEEE